MFTRAHVHTSPLTNVFEWRPPLQTHLASRRATAAENMFGCSAGLSHLRSVAARNESPVRGEKDHWYSTWIFGNGPAPVNAQGTTFILINR